MQQMFDGESPRNRNVGIGVNDGSVYFWHARTVVEEGVLF